MFFWEVQIGAENMRPTHRMLRPFSMQLAGSRQPKPWPNRSVERLEHKNWSFRCHMCLVWEEPCRSSGFVSDRVDFIDISCVLEPCFLPFVCFQIQRFQVHFIDTLLQYMSLFIGTRRLGPISIDGVEFWNCFILRFAGEEASQVTRRPDTDLKEGLHDVVPVS